MLRINDVVLRTNTMLRIDLLVLINIAIFPLLHWFIITFDTLPHTIFQMEHNLFLKILFR